MLPPAARLQMELGLPGQVTSGRRVALLQFALSSLAVLLVVGTIGAVALRHVATREALHDARSVTAVLARGVIAPELSAAVLRGDPAAIARLDRLVRTRVLQDPTVRVKVWTPDGRIVYSDAAGLIGHTYPPAEDLREALRHGAGRAEMATLSRPENRFERGEGRLVEVYLPVRAQNGAPVVVETYRRAGSLGARGSGIWRDFLPVLVLVLLALAAAQVPLASFLARRVRAQEHERLNLALEAESTVEAERLRIAAELHDGVVQDLAGTAFELQAAADALPEDPYAEPGTGLVATLRRGERVCRDSVRALRGLLLELHPSGRRAEDLDVALDGLAAPLRSRGLDVSVDVALERELPPNVSELVYRATQEALRNVSRHADAHVVDVVVRGESEAVTLLVEDNGRGMTVSDLDEQIISGHMGLRLLADGVCARGGSVQIESEPGAGTRISLRLPWA